MPERGVVIGKFLPFHRGHRFLVETALAGCDALSVVVCTKATDPIPGELRARWIREAHPAATVILVDDDELGLADDDSVGWAAATRSILGFAPEVVFTSEDYGVPYAAALGSRHVLVDRERRTVPISGTAIRVDPLGHLDWLDPPVRAHYVNRVCILGAESTGKTTLAAALAARLNTLWVPEHGRVYSETRPPGPWRSAEFLHIARTQQAYEDFLAGYANRVLVCDTDAFVTARFHEAYLGAPAPDELEALAARPYDLFVLTDLATPFVQDGDRMGDQRRAEMHAAYDARLRAGSAPWIAVAGTHAERLEAAVSAVASVLA